jgi:hypothetical protein
LLLQMVLLPVPLPVHHLMLLRVHHLVLLRVHHLVPLRVHHLQQVPRLRCFPLLVQAER